jgi:hypothetical protein
MLLRFSQVILCCSVVLTLAAATDQNPTLTVNWGERTRPCPAALDKGANVDIIVQDVNDFLYAYAFDLKSFLARAGDSSNLPKQQAAEPTNTDAFANDLANAEAAFDRISVTLQSKKALKPDPGDRRSIPLSKSIEDWNALTVERSKDIVLLNTALNEDPVVGDPNYDSLELRKAQLSARAADFLHLKKIADGSDSQTPKHQSKFTAFIDPNSVTTLKIVELRDGEPTIRGTYQWRCNDEPLTLSLGTLFTTLSYRTYEGRKVPGTTANSSNAQVVVNDNGRWTPQGTALLNYRLPLPDRTPDWFAMQISSGPVFKFGGSPSVSTFGYFGGLSFSLWRRLYLTPGVHVGEFADFPAGFVQGQMVPSNFGELNPVTRWTAHFAFSITYRTLSFQTKSSASDATTKKGNATTDSGGDPNNPSSHNPDSKK